MPRLIQHGIKLGSKLRLPTLKEAQNDIFWAVLSLCIAFFVWYASYNGWFIFSNPTTPFVINTVERSKAITWQDMKKDYPQMLWSDTFFPTQIHFNLSTQYWDKVLYPKDLFVLRVSIKNSGSNTLWYPSILILIIDSSDLVRGKHFIQLWSADDSIKPGVSKEYILYFHVPDDMKAQNFFAEAVLYGKIEYSCPQITMYNQLLMLENKIYGTIPEDPNRNWLLAETNGFFHSYPPCVPYVFQVISIATNTLFTAILVIMVRTSEKTKKALSAYIPFITIPIFMAILFLIVFLLSHLLF